MRKIPAGTAFLVILFLLVAGCSDEPRTSDLYLLEELETAASVEDPDERLERLEIFIANNSSHPYRKDAHTRIVETMASDKEDLDGALAYFNRVLEEESDPGVQAQLQLSKFQLLWDQDSLAAVDFADKVAGSDLDDYKLLLYIGYYIMGSEGLEELTGRIFEKVISVTGDPVKKDHARTVYAGFLEKQGRRDEALEMVRKASDYTFANEMIGRDLWEKGEREKALDAYIRLVAGAPGYRKYSKLDSLYTLVYPDASDLDSRLAAERIVEGGGDPLPDMKFVDINGRCHSISGYRGRKLVITAFSPT
jgi:tetratricopeptide (TPR) repeat protein